MGLEAAADGAGGTRWGILGGIFDPIHYAHLAIAEQTREALDLAGVLFLPAGKPVHRSSPAASAQDRLKMVELATADNPRFAVSALEVESEEPSYSVGTLERLTAERPDDKFVFIMSAETALGLSRWRDPLRLLELAEVAIVPRLGFKQISREWLDEIFPGRGDRFTFVDASHLGHSASEIRARRKKGKSIRYLVPPTVEAYMTEHNLYREQELDGSDDRPAA